LRRADRLFQIIQLLRGRRRAVTAARLAEQLGVSERTVYRDIRDLTASGTPIEGAAGVGYAIRRDYDLPPLMFSPEEIEALALGARVVAAFGDDDLVRAAGSALSKVEAALPARLRPRMAEAALFAPRTWTGVANSEALLTVRTALAERRKLRLRYEDREGRETDRRVRPLGAFFWGRSWTVTTWCDLRGDFRTFRLDRMREVALDAERFQDEPGRTLRDYLADLGPHAERLLGD